MSLALRPTHNEEGAGAKLQGNLLSQIKVQHLLAHIRDGFRGVLEERRMHVKDGQDRHVAHVDGVSRLFLGWIAVDVKCRANLDFAAMARQYCITWRGK